MTALAAAEEFNVLRIPLYEFIIALVAFFIVLIVLAKVALPSVRKVLDDREKAIAGGIQKAEQAQEQSAQLKAQLEQELDAARQEAAEIRAQAQQDKAQIIDEARQQAVVAAKQVTDQAQAAIEADRAKAAADLRTSVGSMAVDLAGRIVGESLTDDARSQRVIDRFIDSLEQTSAGS
jgi:F-type H+-transporting ATPase subunit b